MARYRSRFGCRLPIFRHSRSCVCLDFVASDWRYVSGFFCRLLRSGGPSPQRTLPTPRMRALDPPIRKAARRGRGPLDPTNRRTSSLPRDAPCRPARPLQGSIPSGAISECLGDRRDRRAVLPRPPMHSLLPEKAAAVNREARRVQGYQGVNAGPGGPPARPRTRVAIRLTLGG